MRKNPCGRKTLKNWKRYFWLRIFQGNPCRLGRKNKSSASSSTLISPKRIEKLYTYAHLRNDEDKTHYAQNQGNFEKVVRLAYTYCTGQQLYTSELMAIPEDMDG